MDSPTGCVHNASEEDSMTKTWIVSLWMAWSVAASAHPTVYVLGNEADANRIHVYEGMQETAAVETGGKGSGAGLGGQRALVSSPDWRWLFAVDAGSNELTALALTRHGVTPVATVASGGEMPISIAYHDGLLYVLNAGGAGNITGFTFDGHSLQPLAGSTRGLGGDATGPAEIAFAPDGRQLVVTEKMANAIVTYDVDCDGVAGQPQAHASAGMTPFGFAFDGPWLIVSEAFGGTPGASAVSSYDPAVMVRSASVPTTQTAACWIAIAGGGRYAYTTNTGSGSITGYRVRYDGTLRRLDADGRTGVLGDGSSPIDMAVARGTLFALDSAKHTFAAFHVESDGALQPLAVVAGLPASASGIVAR
jgi:6-phosphogluconolactonase (cycloisomerase 2 family)